MGAQQNNALLSVYNKEGIVEFAQGLDELGWNIYSSGGTGRKISEESDVGVTDVAELVGGKDILGHRVVTLSREVHAGLLADKSNPDHMEELDSLGIPLIDLVCVDMYPLEEAVKSSASEEEVTEATDVGGPTMLHSAAKGRRIVLSRPEQRQPVLDWLEEGSPHDELVRSRLAAVAESEVSEYIGVSARFLGGITLGDAASNPTVRAMG